MNLTTEDNIIKDYYNDMNKFKSIEVELGSEQLYKFVNIFKKTRLYNYFNFVEIYEAYAGEMENINKEISFSSFKKFIIKRNTELSSGDYSWFKEEDLRFRCIN